MKAENALAAIIQVALQCEGDAAEGDILPRDFFGPEERYFQALLAGEKLREGEMGPIEQMDLIDVGNADHGERGFDNDFGASFLDGFAGCGSGRSFAVLHEAGR